MSVFIDCCRDLNGVDFYNSIEHEGKKLSLYLEKGFFPKKGFILVRGEGVLEAKKLQHEIKANQIDTVLLDAASMI